MKQIYQDMVDARIAELEKAISMLPDRPPRVAGNLTQRMHMEQLLMQVQANPELWVEHELARRAAEIASEMQEELE